MSDDWSEVFARIGAGEADREREGSPPYDEVRALADAGYGLLRLPRDLGGDEVDVEHLIGLTVDLASHDPHVAHVWRNHFLFTEAVRADPALYAPWHADLAEHRVFGLGFGETGMPRAGLRDFSTRLSPDPSGGWRLDGTKFYSTGNLYADRMVVQALTPDGRVAHAVVATDLPGVRREDDWDGIGQRFTASGTTVFTDVALGTADVLTAQELATDARKSPLAQVYLTAVVAGITAGAARAGQALVRGRGRNYFHGLHPEPVHDPLLHVTLGRLDADAYAARAIVLAAARSLDRALSDGVRASMEKAALDAARAKVVVDELATRTTSGLLDAGSASAVRAPAGLDRFWRNARTVIAHNPGSYKLRVLGDHLLHGTVPPEEAFF